MGKTSTMNMTDYDREYNGFQWLVPDVDNFTGDVVDKWAEDAEKLAMLWVDDDGLEIRRTYREVSLASKRLANVLTEQGGEKGDVVILILP